jgi:hypothetical protein
LVVFNSKSSAEVREIRVDVVGEAVGVKVQIEECGKYHLFVPLLFQPPTPLCIVDALKMLSPATILLTPGV